MDTTFLQQTIQLVADSNHLVTQRALLEQTHSKPKRKTAVKLIFKHTCAQESANF